jgi:predicted ABC-class ATPase
MMANQAAERAYEDITFDLQRDEDDDVVATEDGLLVHGKLFAFLDGADLVIELSDARTRDLTERGVAARYETAERTARNWVRISDVELWPELAREAHQFVGEPPVGGAS